jgi:mono/diheme cytochrome c family protein
MMKVEIPKPLVYVTAILVVCALVPPALIARLRAMNSPLPRVHLIQDMDNQLRFEAQHANPLFQDGRAMRPPVSGTVARGEARLDEHFERGLVKGGWATGFPAQVTVDEALLLRGRQRFTIYCQPCHGVAGYGDGMINRRAMQLVDQGINGTTWVQPKSIHEQAIREQPVGQIFNSITNGVRNMPPYGPQIPVADRWAIVAYVKALQRSQNARSGDDRQ